MNVKKTDSKKSTKRKPAQRKSATASRQIASLRRELREVKEERDCFAKQIAIMIRPEIDEILRNEPDLLKYAGEKPTIADVVKVMVHGAGK